MSNLVQIQYFLKFFGYKNGIVSDVGDNLLIRDVHNANGDATITYCDHDSFSNYAKAYIIFRNSSENVEITPRFRYYGTGSDFKFLFYSRCVRGIQKIDFHHELFDVNSTDNAGTILFFEPINLKGNKIYSLGDPTDDPNAVNLGYLKSKYLALDGSRKMTGNLNMNKRRILDCARLCMTRGYGYSLDMGAFKIINLGSPRDRLDAVPKYYVDSRLIELVKLDGSRSMTGTLNMGNHPIIGIQSDSVDDSALTVGGAKSLYYPLSGSRGMQGNLNMGSFSIVNMKPFVEIDTNAGLQAQSNMAINYGYFHTQRGELKNAY